MPSSRKEKRNRKEGGLRNWRDDFNHLKERFEYEREKREETKGKSKKEK